MTATDAFWPAGSCIYRMISYATATLSVTHFYLVITNQLNRLGFNHRLLRIHHEINQGFYTVQLVVTDGTNSLFTHSALVTEGGSVSRHCWIVGFNVHIRVSRRLVMMRIRN